MDFKHQPVDQELVKHILNNHNLDKGTVEKILSYNMVTPKWFAYLAGCTQGQINRWLDPLNPKLDSVYPFPKFGSNKKFAPMTGPRMIALNEKSFMILKKRKYARRFKVSPEGDI